MSSEAGITPCSQALCTTVHSGLTWRPWSRDVDNRLCRAASLRKKPVVGDSRPAALRGTAELSSSRKWQGPCSGPTAPPGCRRSMGSRRASEAPPVPGERRGRSFRVAQQRRKSGLKAFFESMVLDLERGLPDGGSRVFHSSKEKSQVLLCCRKI